MAELLSVGPKVEAEILDLLVRGWKIAAVRRYREETGAPLDQAMEALEGLDGAVEQRRDQAGERVLRSVRRTRFYRLSGGMALPPGADRLLDADDSVLALDGAALERFSISPALALELLGPELAEPGRSAAAQARKAALVPTPPGERVQHVISRSAGYLDPDSLRRALHLLRKGDLLIAVHGVVLSLGDSRPPRWLWQLLSDCLVALGREPLEPLTLPRAVPASEPPRPAALPEPVFAELVERLRANDRLGALEVYEAATGASRAWAVKRLMPLTEAVQGG